MANFFSRLLDTNQKEISRLQKIVEKVNAHEGEYKKLKDTQLKKKTEEFKKRLADGETLEDLLPEAFSLVRETSGRILGMRHYDVQLLAGVALFEGKVAEQKTGEGKTLSASTPLYLRALAGKGVHLVTVNDYLARLGAGWNAPVYAALGMTTGVIAQEGKSYIYDPDFTDSSHGDERLSHLKPVSRKEAYAADITYGTNNEYGFDYLRDNMVPSLDQMVQRGHYFAIVDEVDSILIDEARTPLIISAPDTEPTQKYYQFAQIVDKLSPETDYTIDEKSRSATLTEVGIEKVEKVLGYTNLYEQDFEAIHHIENALRARALYLVDKDYIVKDGEVIIVDEFTGRLMPGRRWSDGLHQAVEAKEKVVIQQESKTLATISFQNYFRQYEHLSGMTGTAVTEAEEFKKIYKLEVVAVPTHRPMVRKDTADSIYKTLSGKYDAIAEEVAKLQKEGRPVLIGTTSIEKNEIVAQQLKKRRILHNVLNAKNHEKEATIIAEAGRQGAVTIATNMAGRGVDIILGGGVPEKPDDMTQEEFQKSKKFIAWKKAHDEVVKLGGLHVIGTERHESRRIDNQLRGRAGRQGDPGSSKFYLSLEDDLMRIFGGEQIAGIMNRLNLPEDQPIENGIISRAIEQAQVKVEGFHFDTRKRLVEFDDVNNAQRDIVYKLRRRVLEAENLREEVLEKIYHEVDNIVLVTWPEMQDQANYEQAVVMLSDIIPFDDASRTELAKRLTKFKDKEKFTEALKKVVTDMYKHRTDQVGEDAMRQIEKYSYLGAIDRLWMEHIDTIDDLRQGINLRALGQKDPLVEFKNEAYNMFESLMERIDDELARRIFRVGVVERPKSEIPLDKLQENVDTSDQTGLAEEKPVVKKNASKKTIGRNDPCWCGSGKKWKKCHYPQQPQ